MSDVFVNIGDTVHIADETIIDPKKPVDAAPTIADLLARSRAAHQRFQQASGHNDGKGKIRHPDDDAAAVAIQQAREARRAAQTHDPDHLDPSWALDQAANKGVNSDLLLAFYDDYFAADVPL